VRSSGDSGGALRTVVLRSQQGRSSAPASVVDTRLAERCAGFAHAASQRRAELGVAHPEGILATRRTRCTVESRRVLTRFIKADTRVRGIETRRVSTPREN